MNLKVGDKVALKPETVEDVAAFEVLLEGRYWIPKGCLDIVESAPCDHKYACTKCGEALAEKLYNGKVVCVEYTNPCGVGYFTVGKVYEVVDGELKDNTGTCYFTGRARNFADLNRSYAKFIELVE